MDNQVLIALVGVIYILGEVIKFFVSKKSNGVSKKNNGFTPEDRQKLHELFNSHKPKDTDGIPLWYMPRRFLEMQSLTNDKLESVASELQKINSTFDKCGCPYRKNTK